MPPHIRLGINAIARFSHRHFHRSSEDGYRDLATVIGRRVLKFASQPLEERLCGEGAPYLRCVVGRVTQVPQGTHKLVLRAGRIEPLQRNRESVHAPIVELSVGHMTFDAYPYDRDGILRYTHTVLRRSLELAP